MVSHIINVERCLSMTKEEFNSVMTEVSKKWPSMKQDKELVALCAKAAKAEDTEGFKVLLNALMIERSKRRLIEGNWRAAYAMAYAFVVYIYSQSLNEEDLTDEAYENFKQSMYNGLAFVLKQINTDYPTLDVKDSEEVLDATQAGLEALNADFVNIVTEGAEKIQKDEHKSEHKVENKSEHKSESKAECKEESKRGDSE